MAARRLERYRTDPLAFIDDLIKKNEKGQPWSLSPYQRRVIRLAFKWNVQGRLMLALLLWSETKKSGKTFIAACLALWWAFVTAYTEIIVAANDLEQSEGRVFRTIVQLLDHNPELARSATVRATEVSFTNGTVIRPISSDYRGEAGHRHSLVIFDELWGYVYESLQRLFEELTPPPTEPDAWMLVVSTAGWIGESVLLEDLYKRGLAGERLDTDLEVYLNEDHFMFWSHTPRQPWQTDSYYNSQRRILRPATYLRLHENQWVTSETTFITPALWDPCVDPDLSPLLPTNEHQLFVGVDAGIKHDNAAVVAVRWDGDKLALVSHRIWRPTPREPLDLEATIEEYLRELCDRYSVSRILCDPFQLHRSISTLQGAGLKIEEFPQSTVNTTRMGQVLFDLLNGKNKHPLEGGRYEG